MRADPERGHDAVRRRARRPRLRRRGQRARVLGRGGRRDPGQPGRVLARLRRGARGGRPLVDRYGRYLLVRPHEVDKAEAWFERRGEAAVFVSRLLPVIRTFISLPAGIARMPFWRFTVYTVLGCLPWCVALAWLGAVLGARWETVEGDLPAGRVGDRRGDRDRGGRAGAPALAHGPGRVRGARRRARRRDRPLARGSPASSRSRRPRRPSRSRPAGTSSASGCARATDSESDWKPSSRAWTMHERSTASPMPLRRCSGRHRDRQLRASSRRRTRSPGSASVNTRYQAAPTGLPSTSATTPPSPWRPHALVVADEHRVGEDLFDRLARPVRVPPRGLVQHLLQEGERRRSWRVGCSRGPPCEAGYVMRTLPQGRVIRLIKRIGARGVGDRRGHPIGGAHLPGAPVAHPARDLRGRGRSASCSRATPAKADYWTGRDRAT